MTANKAQPLFTDAIRTGESFALEVAMRFAGLPSVNSVKQVIYRTQCIARHLSTGATLQLGDVTANVPVGNGHYMALLPDVTFPQPGVYRVKVVVSLQNVAAESSCFKIPALQVIN